MNGLLAAIFWTSAVINPNGSIANSLAVERAEEFTSYGLSVLEYQNQEVGSGIQLNFGHDTTYGPLQRMTSVSLTDQVGFWVGHGFYNEIDLFDKFSAGFSFVPGLYNRANEVDLGGWLMFRSGLQVNYNISEKYSVSVSFDHRSSGDIWEFNPGLETWQIKLRSYL